MLLGKVCGRLCRMIGRCMNRHDVECVCEEDDDDVEDELDRMAY